MSSWSLTSAASLSCGSVAGGGRNRWLKLYSARFPMLPKCLQTALMVVFGLPWIQRKPNALHSI
jgi:hypothetical protein